MTTEGLKTYDGLSEEDKKKHVRLNEDGDFIERSAVGDREVAHRIAELENEAFGLLEASIAQRDISAKEIIEKLEDKKISYDEKNRLQEMLFESADLERLKGSPIDSELEEMLKKSYTRLRYSKVLSERVIEGISIGDVGVIGEVLKDKKMRADYRLAGKLTNDEERQGAFTICKENPDAACSIIDNVEDIDLAISMYSEALTLLDPSESSYTYKIESSGKRLANKLFEAGATRKIVELMGNEILQLSQCKDFLHRFGSEPEIIMELTVNAKKIEDIYYALKLITNTEILTQLAEDTSRLINLTDEERVGVARYAGEIAQALENEPEVIVFSNFNEDKEADFGNFKLAQNKFVACIDSGKYIIAWSNVEESKYHKDIFQKIGRRLSAQSGGYIGIGENEGKKQIRMVRSSSDYGFYSSELLEHYRDAIEKTLEDVLGDEPFELVIKTSSEYE